MEHRAARCLIKAMGGDNALWLCPRFENIGDWPVPCELRGIFKPLIMLFTAALKR